MIKNIKLFYEEDLKNLQTRFNYYCSDMKNIAERA